MRLLFRLALAAALTLGAGLPSSAQRTSSFLALNGLRVVPESPDTFGVLFRSRAGDADYWCAAGEFAAIVLGQGGRTRLYRLSEPPRKQGKGIRFSLSPEGASSRTGLTVFGSGPRDSVAVSTARGVCTRYIPRLDF